MSSKGYLCEESSLGDPDEFPFLKSSWLNAYVVKPTINWSRFISHVESLGFAVAVGSVCIDDLKMLIES